MDLTNADFIRHRFAGGWGPDLGPSIDVIPADGNVVRIPYLLQARNLIYQLNGAPRKMPGLDKLISAALESGADIRGLFDYWISGTSGTPLQHRVVHVGTKVKKDDADGTFTDIFTGMTAGAPPVYSVMEDVLGMVNGSDHPKTWDGSTAQDMAGTPPTTLSWLVHHKNRWWGGGDAANKSRVYYTAQLTSDWVGAGSGDIDVDSNDGDGCTGAISHQGELIIFKGPRKGSIHRLQGSAPTGDDPFRLVSPFIKGVGCPHHNCIAPYNADIVFISNDGFVRSLSTTAAFGDYAEATLSLPINSWINDHLNKGVLENCWVVNFPALGVVLFAVPIDGSDVPNCVLAMDYRNSTANAFGEKQQPVRWALWDDLSTQCVSLGQVIDSSDNNRPIVMAGGGDGFIRRMGRPERSIDGTTAINYVAQTPFFSYGRPFELRTIYAGSIGFSPKNNGDVTFGWTRGNNAQQTQSVSQQGSGDVLGPSPLNPFTLDTSTLGGSTYADSFFELHEGGDFRTISYEVRQSALNEDVEIHTISAAVSKDGSVSLENDV